MMTRGEGPPRNLLNETKIRVEFALRADRRKNDNGLSQPNRDKYGGGGGGPTKTNHPPEEGGRGGGGGLARSAQHHRADGPISSLGHVSMGLRVVCSGSYR